MDNNGIIFHPIISYIQKMALYETKSVCTCCIISPPKFLMHFYRNFTWLALTTQKPDLEY